MKKLLILVVIVVLIGVGGQGFANSGLFYVDASKLDNSGDGLSWANAKRDIQAAVDLITSQSYYDKIWVTNGVYNQGGAVSDFTSTMTNRVALNSYHDNMIIEAVNKGFGDTVIVGAPDPGTGGNGPGAIRCFHGNDHDGDSSGTVWLNGFTLTNGYTKLDGTPWADQTGGAIHSARATNCWIVGNHAVDGGAMGYAELYNCRVFDNVASHFGGASFKGKMFNCTVYTNQASRGGAAHSTIFHDCVISNNYGTSMGGAMQGGCEAYDCLIVDNHTGGRAGVMLWSCIASNCVIRGNIAAGYGSVIGEPDTDSYRCYLYNCLLEDNVASGNYGGAVMGYATLVNCTVVSNRADIGSYSAGLEGYVAGALLVTNCIIYGNINTSDGTERNYTNVEEMAYCLTTPDPTGESYDGGGNITGDPLFRDPANGDYHLSNNNNSPAIDAGIDTGITLDLDGIIRPQDGNSDGSSLYDIGCYEHIYVQPLGTIILIN